MGKIYYLFGKSASGKDSLYRELIRDPSLGLTPVVLYTTRPMRRGETDGVDYHFVTEEEMQKFVRAGQIIEMRTYETVRGLWTYAMVDDGNWDAEADYLAEGVLASYCSTREYFGAARVVPLYIEVEDGERLQRALNRERKQPVPQYSEMCRRFLADQVDFAPEKLQAAGIDRVYRNGELTACVRELKTVIAASREARGVCET
ncbi:MAG: guanylate kinase [Lachnospiraceae bacterium]|nr:guanylate kinase [Lachnospiraceae bacterium]